MAQATQPGITPPAPGQDKEEPELRQEDDIPVEPDQWMTQDGTAHDPGVEPTR